MNQQRTLQYFDSAGQALTLVKFVRNPKDKSHSRGEQDVLRLSDAIKYMGTGDAIELPEEIDWLRYYTGLSGLREMA